jgi:hypothetical protein
MAGRCPHCSHLVPALADKRLPPWCPRCGADFNPDQGSREMGREESTMAGAPPASYAIERPPLSWREPTAPSPALRPSTSGPDESLAETIERVRGSQRAKTHERWQNRWAGLGAFFGDPRTARRNRGRMGETVRSRRGGGLELQRFLRSVCQADPSECLEMPAPNSALRKVVVQRRNLFSLAQRRGLS